MATNTELKLMIGGRIVFTTKSNASLGKRDFEHLDTDAKYLSNPQFHLFKNTDQSWTIEHDGRATNETLLNDMPITGRMQLINNSIIAVGNSTKEIRKFPLTCKLLTLEDHLLLQFDIKALLQRLNNSLFMKWIKGLLSNFFGFCNSIKWSHLGTVAWSTLRVVLTVTGTILVGFLSGVFRGSGAGSGLSGRTLIRRGNSLFGEVLLTIDDRKVRVGDSMFGQVVMTIEGNQIRYGDSMFGTVLATLEGNSVREGNSIFGTTIATIDGNTVHEGSSIFGTVIATIDGGGRMAGTAAAVYLLRM